MMPHFGHLLTEMYVGSAGQSDFSEGRHKNICCFVQFFWDLIHFKIAHCMFCLFYLRFKADILYLSIEEFYVRTTALLCCFRASWFETGLH